MYAKTDEKGVVFEFITSPEEGAVEVGDGPFELTDAVDECYKYKIVDGELVERTAAEREADWKFYEPPTQEEMYAKKVAALVLKKYKVADELALLRQRDTKPEEFAAYNAYVEQCKEQARKEVYGNG